MEEGSWWFCGWRRGSKDDAVAMMGGWMDVETSGIVVFWRGWCGVELLGEGVSSMDMGVV
jgi:hypothetical protein